MSFICEKQIYFNILINLHINYANLHIAFLKITKSTKLLSICQLAYLNGSTNHIQTIKNNEEKYHIRILKHFSKAGVSHETEKLKK